MRFVIYGAGAIGSTIGGHLWRTGHDALLVGRPGHVGVIQERGLTLVTPDESFHLRVPATTDAVAEGLRPDDLILLCCKSQDTETALQEIRAAGADPERTAIFCCQNSITNEPAAVRYFARVYGVLIVLMGIYLEDGLVHNPVRGNAGYIEVGRYPSGVDDRAEDLVAALRVASFAAAANPGIMAPKGTKMLGNLGNAFSAITDGRGDEQAFLAALRSEAKAVLDAADRPHEAEGVFSARARSSRRTNELPPGMRNLGSSWQSLVRHQGSTEADFLNGEIVRLGRIQGIATPYNALVQRIATEMAARREAPGRYTAEELMGMV